MAATFVAVVITGADAAEAAFEATGATTGVDGVAAYDSGELI